MIHIDWNPVAHLGPIPINWYGLGWAAAFLAGGALTRRRAARERIAVSRIEDLVVWILIGSLLGARLSYVAQNDPLEYLREPWRILAIWEGGLAFFGGLFGGIFAAWLYVTRAGLKFAQVADLFAPAIPIGAAIGRIPCGLDGMDYGTPTALPWGVVYDNPASYAPNDGVARHPDQFYELAGDLLIAAVLIKLRPRLPQGATFLLYLVLFGVFRFFLFFVRGNVPVVALGLKNGQWTALAIVAVAVPLLVMRFRQVHRTRVAPDLGDPVNQKSLVWVLVAIGVLVLVPLLGMIGMMGTGSAMMGGGMTCCAGMTGWALVWMLLLAALIIAAIVLLVRSVTRS